MYLTPTIIDIPFDDFEMKMKENVQELTNHLRKLQTDKKSSLYKICRRMGGYEGGGEG
jgi:hypothetical protein